MFNTVIVDDDPSNINMLQTMIGMYCPQIRVCATARNAAEAYSAIREHQPSLVFLDIEMPNGNGFELLEKFDPIPFEVIFVTAYDQYALEAFRKEALDYLLKPINIEDLQQAVSRIEKRNRPAHDNHYLKQLLQDVQAGNQHKIGIPVIDGILFIHPKDIIRCEASGSYSIFYMTNGKKLTTSLNLKECETLLPEGTFFRTHHSHIANVNYIVRYVKGRGGYIIMEDNSSIELSIRKKEAFLAFMKNR